MPCSTEGFTVMLSLHPGGFVTGADNTTRSHDLTFQEVPVEFIDRFTNGNRRRIDAEIRSLVQLAAEFYEGVPGSVRKRVSRIDRSNPATQSLAAKDPAIGEWLATVPSTAALDPLYDPQACRMPSGVRIGDEMREWIKNIADARGIRSRAHVVRSLLTGSAVDRTAPGQSWLSLACGAAQPVLAAVDAIRHGGIATPSVTLLDADPDALALARRYAAQRHLTAATICARANVLDRNGIGAGSLRIPGFRHKSNWLDTYDVVEAVGILEYLQVEDWTYTYRGVISSKKRLAGAATFLRNAFACVRPGGMLVVGNMLDTHPQLGFTLDVIQWPHIQPRSVSAMLAILRSAGVTGHVNVYLPCDGVYAIYAIHKSRWG